MSKTFNDHIESFKVGSRKDLGIINFGFSYAFYDLLTAIPAGFGHILDSLFYLNGSLFGHKPDQPMHGPLGFLLGLPFAVVGLVVGMIVQVGISLVSFVGFVLDRLLSLMIKGFEQGMVPEQHNPELLRILSGLFIANVYDLPYFMRGPFGFLLGVFPEIARGIILSLLAYPAAIVHTITSGLAAGLSLLLYGPAGQKGYSTLPAAGTQKIPRRRLKMNADVEDDLKTQMAAEALKKADEALTSELVEQQIDLFKLFSMSLDDDVNKPYRRLNLVFHADKYVEFQEVLGLVLAAKESPKQLITLVSGQPPLQMTVEAFLRLTEIDANTASVANGDAYKANQEIAFKKIANYKRILDTPELRQQYCRGMRFTVQPNQTAAGIMASLSGGGGQPENPGSAAGGGVGTPGAAGAEALPKPLVAGGSLAAQNFHTNSARPQGSRKKLTFTPEIGNDSPVKKKY